MTLDIEFLQKVQTLRRPMMDTDLMEPLLYGLIRNPRPCRVLEFGMGCTTSLILRALAENQEDAQREAVHMRKKTNDALARLADGGRLVAIIGARFAPDNPAWTDAFVRLQERARVVFTAAVAGSVYARHGTTIDTRLMVFDKSPADDPSVFPPSHGMAPDVTTLLDWVTESVPPRLPAAVSVTAPTAARSVRSAAKLSGSPPAALIASAVSSRYPSRPSR